MHRPLLARDPYLQWALEMPLPGPAEAQLDLLIEATERELQKLGLAPLRFDAPGTPAPLPSALQPVLNPAAGVATRRYGPDRPGERSIHGVTAPRSRLAALLAAGRLSRFALEQASARWAPPEEGVAALQGSARLAPGTARGEGPRLRGRVMVVIDDGLAFLHSHFRTAAGDRTRIAWLWDQNPQCTALPGGIARALDAAGGGAGPHAASPWAPAEGFGYGRVLDAAAIDRALARVTVDGEDETQVYAALHYADRVRHALTHGTHVADLCCGHRPPGAAAGPDAAGDDDTRIILVQLPPRTVADTSGGGLAKHALDALAYALDHIADDASVVVNLSYGATAGPHDGQTLFERALDGMCASARERLRHFALVLPAGNQFEAGGHAALHVAPGATASLALQVRVEDPTESFCELWFEAGTALRDLRIEVQAPDGTRLRARLGRVAYDAATPRASMCSLSWAADAAASPGRAMALLALLPSRSLEPGRKTAPAGPWTFSITNDGAEAVDLQAWVQRDEAIGHSPFPARQALFPSARPRPPQAVDDVPADAVKRRATGNSIANGVLPIVAGACVALSARPSTYTSAAATGLAPGRARWPDLCAPGDLSESMPGIAAASTRSGLTVRMNGSSVAAAQVSRAVMNLFADGTARRPDNAAIVHALIQRHGEFAHAGHPRSAISRARVGAGWIFSRPGQVVP
ncbi:S8 family serine peptidase [Xenophilus aerolatus]|nr:S8 family serine peptidase [Xenophilus aerolatus]